MPVIDNMCTCICIYLLTFIRVSIDRQPRDAKTNQRQPGGGSTLFNALVPHVTALEQWGDVPDVYVAMGADRMHQTRKNKLHWNRARPQQYVHFRLHAGLAPVY